MAGKNLTATKHKTCTYEGCDNPRTVYKKWCFKHHKRWQIHGSPDILKIVRCIGLTCLECDRPARKQSLCNSHYTKKWRFLNPELANKNKQSSSYNRSQRKRNAEGSHTRLEWEALIKLFAGRCAYCRSQATTKDHIIPIHNGGTDFIWNIVPACRHCNATKHTKLLGDFLGINNRS